MPVRMQFGGSHVLYFIISSLHFWLRKMPKSDKHTCIQSSAQMTVMPAVLGRVWSGRIR